MMTIRQFAFATLVSMSLAAGAQAAESPLYFGIKAGLMKADVGGYNDALSVGGLLGYQVLDEPNGSGAVEGEFSTTLSKGKKDSGGSWAADTVAVFFAYRSAGDAFLKGKIGVASQKPDGADPVPNKSNFAYGIGVGVRPSGKVGIELEHTWFDTLRFVSFGFYSRF